MGMNTNILVRTRNLGFTMIEMMIVIAIILVLFSLAWFPYGYYMERTYVENAIDTVGQEWILAQKDIRNGKMFDVEKHANKVLIFRKGSNTIEQYLLSGSKIPAFSEFSQYPKDPNIRLDKITSFDNRVVILGFSGNLIDAKEPTLGYFVEAPYASGAFFTQENILLSDSGVYLTIGYSGAVLDTGRARKVLLKPYLQ